MSAEAPPLSVSALRLLAALQETPCRCRSCAGRTDILPAAPGHAVRVLPDRELARSARLPQRDIIDLADELLAAGHIVIARCAPPMGRWLLPPGADLAPAREYLAQLHGRGLKVLARERRLRRAIELAEQRRDPETSGQLKLGLSIQPTRRDL
jgi:hypothetical protein